MICVQFVSVDPNVLAYFTAGFSIAFFINEFVWPV